jgi:hypothetical protein
LEERLRALRDLRDCTQINRAYHIKKSATTVARPTKTNTATFAEELVVVCGEVPKLVVGVGTVLSVEMVAGALKRNVYEPVNGVSVALSKV